MVSPAFKYGFAVLGLRFSMGDEARGVVAKL
jgi:hypothetical protein